MWLDKEFVSHAAQQMQQDIDREILWKVFEDSGWVRVQVDRTIDNNHAIDITHWIKNNIKYPYARSGADFIFENKKDATMFILRWAS